jgi:hypothetical protein
MGLQIASDELKEFFDSQVSMLRRTAEGTLSAGEQVPAHLMVYRRDGHCVVFEVPIEDNHDKDMIALLQMNIAQRVDQTMGVIFVTETWAVSLEGDELRQDLAADLSEDPRRKEQMMWSIMLGDMQLIAIADIQRAADGNVTLGETIITDVAKSNLSGRMVVGDQSSETHH